MLLDFCGRPIAILLDLPGPKFRLGAVGDGARDLVRDEKIMLRSGPGRPADDLPVMIPGFARTVRKGEPVFLSDGAVQLEVGSIRGDLVHARVLAGGRIRSGSGVNLPETDLRLSLPNRADVHWLRFACDEKIDPSM